MKRIVFGLVVLMMMVFFTDCKKKYPDDSKWMLHFRTPMKRLTRHGWNIKSCTDLFSNTAITPPPNSSCTFYTDGTCNGGWCDYTTFGNPQAYPSYLHCLYGNWALIDNDNTLKIIYNPNFYKLWTIKELETGNMKIESDSVRFEMTPS
jgi:hypothetical protein